MCKNNLDILSLNVEGMLADLVEVRIPELQASCYSVINDENVIYVQCPICGKGYIARLVSIIADTERHILYELNVRTDNNVVIDLVKDQTCYECHGKYNPTKQARVIRTDEFPMRKVMEIKGS